MYLPIEDYGLIGNMRTAALVGRNGSVDWLCFPRFDSPSVFAAILDDKKAGRFAITPRADVMTNKQLYWPETNVLITRFHCRQGIAEIIDFMPVGVHGERDVFDRLIRKVSVITGEVTFRTVCQPAFNYGRDSHETQITPKGACFHSSNLSLGMATEVSLENSEGAAIGDFTLTQGQTVVFTLQGIAKGGGCGLPVTTQQAEEYFRKTVDYWRSWLSQCTYAGRWREMVHRSALALKLLTYEPTGAIVAAPTCSLPETLGGQRNWDYRYTWIRDAAFTLYALMRIGFDEEAANFTRWMQDRCGGNTGGQIQQMYTIDGDKEMAEETLEHLEGYKGSSPVRIGNAAYDQLQLDIYGELMDAAYLHNKYGTMISYDLWKNLTGMVDWVCKNWHRKDEGIWEPRSGPANNVYSKVMCWVAIDRALRIAMKRSFPADIERWRKCRDTIYNEILEKGYNTEKQAFVQSYENQALDAANLIMPLVYFMSPADPRMTKTLEAIKKPPGQGGLTTSGLVYRYNNDDMKDGLSGQEGTFNICSFWLIEALTRAGRKDKAKLEEARLLFDKILGYSNHLGLFAEQTGPCGEALGNFPQAFTHIALISAAYNLNRQLGD